MKPKWLEMPLPMEDQDKFASECVARIVCHIVSFLPGDDTGYPSTARLDDGTLVTVYYSAGTSDDPHNMGEAKDAYCMSVRYSEAELGVPVYPQLEALPGPVPAPKEHGQLECRVQCAHQSSLPFV